MKRRTFQMLVLASVGAVGFFPASKTYALPLPPPEGQKNSNLYPLNNPMDWSGDVVPELPEFASLYVAPANTTLLLGASMSWGGIQIVNPATDVIIGNAPGLALTLGGNSPLTLNDGIDMSQSTVNVTLA